MTGPRTGGGASPAAPGGSGVPRPLALMDGWRCCLLPTRPGTTGPLSRSEATRERPRSLLPFTAGAWLSEQTLRASELQGPPPSKPGAMPLGGTASSLGHTTKQRLWQLEEASLQEAWMRDIPQRALELVTNRPSVKRGGDKPKHSEPELGDHDKGGGALWGHLLKSEMTAWCPSAFTAGDLTWSASLKTAQVTIRLRCDG